MNMIPKFFSEINANDIIFQLYQDNSENSVFFRWVKCTHKILEDEMEYRIPYSYGKTIVITKYRIPTLKTSIIDLSDSGVIWYLTTDLKFIKGYLSTLKIDITDALNNIYRYEQTLKSTM